MNGVVGFILRVVEFLDVYVVGGEYEVDISGI